MPRYFIQGQAGKALDATSRELGRDLIAVNASLRVENLGMDRLTWTARTVDIDAGETILPEVGQMVELFYDLGAFGMARMFRGWVTEARAVNYGTIVVVEGPWQFLRKMTAGASRTLNGTTDTRPTLELEGSISGLLNTVVNLAISAGVPMINGGFAGTSYSIPKTKLSNASYADVIAELLRWMPDCVAYFSYGSSLTAQPIFVVTRRSSLGSQTYTVGTDDVVDYEVTGRPDLVPTRVELKYITRGADQRPVFQMQAAGTSAGSTAAGKAQVIVISGDENDTFLPPDDYNSYVVQTANANTTIQTLRALLLPMIPQVVSSRTQFAGRPTSTDVVLANGETITTNPGSGTIAASRYYPQPSLQFMDAETGAAVSRVGKHFVLGKPAPEWAEYFFANAQKVKITGRIYVLEEMSLHTATGIRVQDGLPVPNWQVAFPWSLRTPTSNFVPSGTLINAPLANVHIVSLDFEIESYLTTSSYPSPQTYYKPQDYDYTSPPSGLATALLGAQNFTPYDGRIELKSAAAPSGLDLTPLTNIAGAQSFLGTMAAMRRAVTVDLLNFTTRIELGSPARFDTKTLAGKVRQTPQSNITITA